MTLRWHWTPGSGGLLALVPDSVLESWRLGAAGRAIQLPPDAAAIKVLHLTCLSSRSMECLVGVLDPLVVLPQLPAIERLAFEPFVYVAERGPHPEKDLPLVTEPRRTGFLAVDPVVQAHCHAVLRAAVSELDRASRSCGGPPFPHPEPERFFHLSVWNNRNGAPRRSIGDIRAADRIR